MCNQAVGLVAAELERRGIPTVTLQLLRFVAEKVRPPRTLLVPYRHGWTLGTPDDPEHQHRVLAAALELFEHAGPGPVLVEYSVVTPAGTGR